MSGATEKKIAPLEVNGETFMRGKSASIEGKTKRVTIN